MGKISENIMEESSQICGSKIQIYEYMNIIMCNI